MAAPLYRNVHLADGGILSVAALDLQPQQVLSTAMPTPAQVGMLAYATDTFQLLQYQSATTGWTPPWNLPWGIPSGGYVRRITDDSARLAAADIALMTITWTAVANRLYAVHANAFLLQNTSTGTPQLLVMEGATQLDIGNAGSLAATKNFRVGIDQILTTVSAGSHTYKLQAGTTAGTTTPQGNSQYPMILYVTDEGPAANPA